MVVLVKKNHLRNQMEKFWKSKIHARNQTKKVWKSNVVKGRNFGNQKFIRQIKTQFKKSNGEILEIKKSFEKSNGQD